MVSTGDRLEECGGEAPGLGRPSLAERVEGAGVACEAGLLASRPDGRRGFHQRGQAGIPYRLRVAEVAEQQPAVDADVEIEDAGAELLHADEAGSCIFGLVTRLEVIDGGVVGRVDELSHHNPSCGEMDECQERIAGFGRRTGNRFRHRGALWRPVGS